jgi:hypothetical protein
MIQKEHAIGNTLSTYYVWLISVPQWEAQMEREERDAENRE